MRTAIFIFFVLCLTGCKPYKLDNLPQERLHFGSRGGVSGQLREYILLMKDGQLLFKDPLSAELEKVGKWKRADLKRVRANLQDIPFGAETSPSNFNTVLIYHTTTQTKSLQWSSPKGAVDEKVQSFFEDLMAEVRRVRKTE